MYAEKLQSVFSRQLRRVVIINNIVRCSTSSSALPYIPCDMHDTSSSINLVLDKQYLVLLNNVSRRYNLGVRDRSLYISFPQNFSGVILRYGEEHVGGRTACYDSRRHNIRHFSSANVNPIAKAEVPFTGIFKTISESTPIRITQDTLLWVHDYTNLPWWLVIVLTTIVMRTAVTLPLSLYQHYIIAKVESLKYEMDEIVKQLQNETRYGIHKYNWPKEYARRLYNHSVKKQWNELIVRENCHPAKTSILILVQVPLWISLSMSIRNLCYMLPKQDASAYATYQEFTMDGFLCFTNLTAADPFVLPIVMGLSNLAIIEITHISRATELTKWKKYVTHFFRLAVIGMIPIAMYVPSSLSLYWATSSAFGVLQNLILLSPKLRRFARVPITASESPHPYLLLRKRIMAKCSWKNKVKIPPQT